MYISFLAEPQYSANGLTFDHWVPLWLEKIYTVCDGEVESVYMGLVACPWLKRVVATSPNAPVPVVMSRIIICESLWYVSRILFRCPVE
jgi:hypothetical protein